MLDCNHLTLPFEKSCSQLTRQAGQPAPFPRKLPDVEDKQLAKWQAQLARTQAELAQLGPMRPGSLSQQYKDPAKKTGAYWQLSYTHNMRSRSRYVRPAEVARIKTLLANFKRFRELVDHCVDLSVQIADRQTDLLRTAEPGQD